MIEIAIKGSKLLISRSLPVKVQIPKEEKFGYVKVDPKKTNFIFAETRIKFEPTEEAMKNRAEFLANELLEEIRPLLVEVCRNKR